MALRTDQAHELTPLNAAHQASSFIPSHAGYTHGLEEQEDHFYRPVSNIEMDCEQKETEPPSQLPIWKALSTQLFAIAWVVPIAVLLVLNFKRHAIGASAWCPFGRCLPQVYGNNSLIPLTLSVEHDRNTRNLLGVLQLVAKSLELWFVAVATWLVYLVTVMIAESPHAIPIAYMLRPTEFSEVPSLFDPLLWTTLRARTRSNSPGHPRMRLWLFILATVLLCMLCNLMGPAVAVLAIPTLQWTATDHVRTGRLDTLNSDYSFLPHGYLANESSLTCNETQLQRKQYSCTRSFSRKLDSWIESYVASGIVESTVSEQNGLSFGPNTTWRTSIDGSGNNDTVVWVPNRQAVQALAADYRMVRNISLYWGSQPKKLNSTEQPYASHINTVQTELHRLGPMLGARTNVWLDFNGEKELRFDIDGDRYVTCYDNYSVSSTPGCLTGCTGVGRPTPETYMRCIPLGSEWAWGAYSNASFGTEPYWDRPANVSRPGHNITVHYSHRAALIDLRNASVVEGLEKEGFSTQCLSRDQSQQTDGSCDLAAWTSLFMSNLTTFPRRTRGVTTITVRSRPTPNPGFPSTIALVVDFTTFSGLADYTLDASWLSNPLLSIRAALDDDQYVASWSLLDASWTLAAWSANHNGLIPGTRSISNKIRNMFSDLQRSYNRSVESRENALVENERSVTAVALIPVLETLSLIEYNVTQDLSVQSSVEKILHPDLFRHARIYVWTYSLSSRTSRLGVAVALAGCVVVLAEVCLGLLDRRRFRSPLQFLISALEHRYDGEFNGMAGSEKAVARVRFKLREDQTRAGRLRYEKVL